MSAPRTIEGFPSEYITEVRRERQAVGVDGSISHRYLVYVERKALQEYLCVLT